MPFLRKLLGLVFQADARSIRRYEEVKHRIAHDLVVYANARVGAKIRLQWRNARHVKGRIGKALTIWR